MSDYTITSPNTLPTHAIRGLWLTAWHYARCIRKAEAAEHPNEANRLINMALYRVGQHLLDLALDALDERNSDMRYGATTTQEDCMQQRENASVRGQANA